MKGHISNKSLQCNGSISRRMRAGGGRSKLPNDNMLKIVYIFFFIIHIEDNKNARFINYLMDSLIYTNPTLFTPNPTLFTSIQQRHSIPYLHSSGEILSSYARCRSLASRNEQHIHYPVGYHFLEFILLFSFSFFHSQRLSQITIFKHSWGKHCILYALYIHTNKHRLLQASIASIY